MVHNFYGSEAPSGENSCVRAEVQMLEAGGDTVVDYFRYSDDIRKQGFFGKVRGALAVPWNPFSKRDLSATIDNLTPDVIHVHNTFPLISPSIFYGISRDIPRVMTLHNYRLFCPKAIPMRAGNICTECLDSKSVLPSIRHACYRDSVIATIPLAGSVALHRRLDTWDEHVDIFIAFSNFQKQILIGAGLSAEKICVKPNFYPRNPEVLSWTARKMRAVYVGRLSKEKGIATLIKAWIKWGSTAPELIIVGAGELKEELEKCAKDHPQVPIRFVGEVSGDAAQKYISKSRLLIVPSECYEGFPMVLGEAFASGTPVAAADLGPLAEIVGDGHGALFSPWDSDSLYEVVSALWEDQGTLELKAKLCRATFEEKYTQQVNYRQLTAVYEKAADSRLVKIKKQRRTT